MFEELFKTGSGLPVSQTTVSPHLKQKFVKTTESLTLLDPQRQRNLGKTLSPYTPSPNLTQSVTDTLHTFEVDYVKFTPRKHVSSTSFLHYSSRSSFFIYI